MPVLWKQTFDSRGEYAHLPPEGEESVYHIEGLASPIDPANSGCATWHDSDSATRQWCTVNLVR